eukprot:SAG31_NODE_1129_length_9755_cov_2.095070_15_plen_390_part_00
MYICFAIVQIKAGMKKHEFLGELVTRDMELARARYSELVDGAHDEIQDCLRDKRSTIAEMDALLARYEDYPDDLHVIKNKLISKLDAAVRTAAEMLERAKSSNDVKQLDSALKLYEDAGERLAVVYSSTKTHRAEMSVQIKKKAATALLSENPEEVKAIFDEIQVYGDELSPEVDKLKERLDVLVEKIVSQLRELAGSDDFSAIQSSLTVYENFEPELKKYWSMQLLTLQQRRDELIDDVSAQLRKLRLESDPQKLAEGLDMFTEYDDVVTMDKESLRDRHRVLIEGAILDIRNCLKDEHSDLRYMHEIVEKFRDFPDRVRELLQGVSNKLESKVLAADKAIRRHLMSTDVDQINAVIVEYEPDEPFLKDALMALTNHRLDLEDEMRHR